MFERFTRNAIKTIMLAQEEARAAKHRTITSGFLLAGLAREGGGLAARALRAIDVSSEKVRAEVQKLEGIGEGASPVEIPCSEQVETVLKRSYGIAGEADAGEIGTEHLLLALLEQESGSAYEALKNCAVEKAVLRQKLSDLISRKGNSQKANPLSNLRQGDVVLMSFEDVDERGKSIRTNRSMVIISSDDCNARLSTVLTIALVGTDQAKDILNIEISASSPEGQTGGIHQDVVAACTFVYTYPKTWIVRKIGSFPESLVNVICAQVRKLMQSSE